MIFDFKDHPTKPNNYLCQVCIVQLKLGEINKEDLTWSGSKGAKMRQYLTGFEKEWNFFLKSINIPNCDINVDTYYLITSKVVSQQVKYFCAQLNEEVKVFINLFCCFLILQLTLLLYKK